MFLGLSIVSNWGKLAGFSDYVENSQINGTASSKQGALHEIGSIKQQSLQAVGTA